jgi:hypothetical protein
MDKVPYGYPIWSPIRPRKRLEDGGEVPVIGPYVNELKVYFRSKVVHQFHHTWAQLIVPYEFQEGGTRA